MKVWIIWIAFWAMTELVWFYVAFQKDVIWWITNMYLVPLLGFGTLAYTLSFYMFLERKTYKEIFWGKYWKAKR